MGHHYVSITYLRNQTITVCVSTQCGYGYLKKWINLFNCFSIAAEWCRSRSVFYIEKYMSTIKYPAFQMEYIHRISHNKLAIDLPTLLNVVGEKQIACNNVQAYFCLYLTVFRIQFEAAHRLYKIEDTETQNRVQRNKCILVERHSILPVFLAFWFINTGVNWSVHKSWFGSYSGGNIWQKTS